MIIRGGDKLNCIKKKREEVNMSQARLGELTGVGQSTVAMWETQDNMPLASRLPLIAEALECGIGDLFEEEN